MGFEQVLDELALDLPAAPKPVGNYVPAVRVGRLLYLSGHGPLRSDKTLITGRVGDELDSDDGYQAARQVGLATLATLRSELGSLDRVERLVKVFGLVYCTPDFGDQPRVLNGFSDLMAEVFGDAGRAARSAVGAAALPARIAVEVESIFLLTDEE